MDPTDWAILLYIFHLADFWHAPAWVWWILGVLVVLEIVVGVLKVAVEGLKLWQ